MKNLFKHFLRDESGDTNFISIIIILGIVVVLAGIFIAFKDTIINGVSGIIGKFNADAIEGGEGAPANAFDNP